MSFFVGLSVFAVFCDKKTARRLAKVFDGVERSYTREKLDWT
jgi:hypothetical protein